MVKKTISGTCHCGAVKFTYSGVPNRIVSCNCSICHRYRALWAHGNEDNITIVSDSGATTSYSWGDKSLAFHSCKTCGCTTHWASLSDDSPKNLAVNMALVEPREIAEIAIKSFDGADTWKFLD